MPATAVFSLLGTCQRFLILVFVHRPIGSTRTFDDLSGRDSPCPQFFASQAEDFRFFFFESVAVNMAFFLITCKLPEGS